MPSMIRWYGVEDNSCIQVPVLQRFAEIMAGRITFHKPKQTSPKVWMTWS
jgi:hypothetical protein